METPNFEKSYLWNKGKNNPMYGVHRYGKDAPFYGKCHLIESKKKTSNSLKRWYETHDSPFKNKNHSKKTRENMVKRKRELVSRGWKPKGMGKHRSEEEKRKISVGNKGQHHSSETEFKSGESHPNWKGGYEYYYGENWEQQRKLVLKRDGHHCQSCGISENGREHDVHHIIPFREFGLKRYKEANNLENLLTLCRSCHAKIEQKGVK